MFMQSSPLATKNSLLLSQNLASDASRLHRQMWIDDTLGSHKCFLREISPFLSERFFIYDMQFGMLDVEIMSLMMMAIDYCSWETMCAVIFSEGFNVLKMTGL